MTGAAMNRAVTVSSNSGKRQLAKILRKGVSLSDAPVHSGRGPDGFIDRIRKGTLDGTDNVVFLHTAVALIGYPEIFDLPGYRE